MKIMLARLRGFYNYRSLFKQLVLRDIKLKYRRSFLGYLWSILSPLLIMLVLVLVFSNIFRFDIPNFPVYLLIGQTLFNFMTESTTSAIFSITGNAALIKKTYVPKYIFTLAKITSSLVNMLFSMAALLIVVLFTGVRLTPWALLFPLVLVELYVFCSGLGLLLAAANVFFRDIQYIYGVITTAWMYLTPIFYPIEILPDILRTAVTNWNPMYIYITQLRDMILYGQAPGQMFIGFAFGLVFLVLGTWFFLRKQDEFILYI